VLEYSSLYSTIVLDNIFLTIFYEEVMMPRVVARVVMVVVCCLASTQKCWAFQKNTKVSNAVQQEVVSLESSPRYPPDLSHGNLYLKTQERTSFDAVSFVAAANLIINAMRPDPTISMQMRVPRLIWEMTILVLAKTATITTVPAIYLVLAFILGSTAVVDLFVWAPLFATFASFETCEGNGFFQPRKCRSDYTKGVGRMLVVFQCIATGLFYLMSSITAMGSFATMREEQKIQRQVRAMQRWDDHQRAQTSNS
jgi:hypothetical protein